jgi:RND family efflux transporter MFP subunit
MMWRRICRNVGGVCSAALVAASCETPPAPPPAPAGAAQSAPAGAIDTARVVSQALSSTLALPGELQPFQSVAVYPKVTGFVKTISVDRGSRVAAGDVIARLEAPELVAQHAEAESRLQATRAQLAAAQAKLAADESSYEHLRAASQTAGVVAGNDLVVAQKAAEASRAVVSGLSDAVTAAAEAARGVAQMEAYLAIQAPFDGTVTERNVHPGELVGPASGRGAGVPMVRIETASRLRLVVPVPEMYVAGLSNGTVVKFTVPDAPGQTFQGPIARIPHAIDPKTRTMPVEVDVANADGRLTSGAFAQVEWPIRRTEATLFVPATAVTTNLERTFVIRIANGQAEWVDVKPGASAGALIEVFGALHEGDVVVARATDAIRPGSILTAK